MFNLLGIIYVKIKTNFWYRLFFKKIGNRVLIFKPSMISNPQNIEIGNLTSIRKGSRLEVILHINKSASLIIGNNVNVEQNVHIVCGNLIKIGDNVSITANCALVDISHPYNDIYGKIKVGARLDCSKSLIIGDGSFVGIGSIILPGAHIGKNCIIGANSVVTKPIPDYCIAAGNPAQVIKKYNFEKEEWIKV